MSFNFLCLRPFGLPAKLTFNRKHPKQSIGLLWLTYTHFPALGNSNLCLLWALIGSLDNCIARVITFLFLFFQNDAFGSNECRKTKPQWKRLFSVSGHSIETRSNVSVFISRINDTDRCTVLPTVQPLTTKSLKHLESWAWSAVNRMKRATTGSGKK